MKLRLLIFVVAAALLPTVIQAQIANQRRYTHRQINYDIVARWFNDAYWPPNTTLASRPNRGFIEDMIHEEAMELTMAKVDQIIVDGYQYEFLRNCHDFAWAPYMSCFCDLLENQREAWIMGDFRSNLADNSMRVVLQSVGKFNGEYFFRLADLQSLALVYVQTTGGLMELPVSDGGTATEAPVHSTYIINDSWFTPTGLDPTYVVCRYISKWGSAGIYYHRWGEGYTPASYNKASSIKIYAPVNWDASWVTHGPW